MINRVFQTLQILIQMSIHIYIIRIQLIIYFHPLIHRLNDLIHFHNILHCFCKVWKYPYLMTYDKCVSYRNISGFFSCISES